MFSSTQFHQVVRHYELLKQTPTYQLELESYIASKPGKDRAYIIGKFERKTLSKIKLELGLIKKSDYESSDGENEKQFV